MEPSLLRHIGRTCLVLGARLDGDGFRTIRQLGIGQRIHTRRGTRSGRIFRKWYNPPPATSVDALRLAPITMIGSPHPTPTTPVVTAVGALNPATATPIVATPTQSSIKCMHLNAQSCGNKTLELADTITDEKFDIVFLSETWFKEVGDEPRIAEMTPKGFLLTNIPRRTGRGGGLAV